MRVEHRYRRSRPLHTIGFPGMTTRDDITLEFPMAQLGQAFSTRDGGLRVLADLQDKMFREGKQHVIVDFTTVQSVSYSFIDGFFGKLAQRAYDRGQKPPIAVGMSPAVRDQVKACLQERGLELHEDSVEEFAVSA